MQEQRDPDVRPPPYTGGRRDALGLVRPVWSGCITVASTLFWGETWGGGTQGQHGAAKRRQHLPGGTTTTHQHHTANV